MITITETNYNDIWCEIKQDILLVLDIDNYQNDNIEYVIIFNSATGEPKTIVHKRTDFYKSFIKSLKPEEIVIAKIDKYMLPKDLIYDKDYDEFVISCLKTSGIEGLYDNVMKKMPNGYDGVDFLFEYPSLDQLLTQHYKNFCKREFIETKLNSFIDQYLSDCLKKLNIKTKITA